MEFYVVNKGERIPLHFIRKGSGSIYGFLQYINWNDFGYYTTFRLFVYSDSGDEVYSTDIRIGYKGQAAADKTVDELPVEFEKLDSKFFSIGSGAEYYSELSDLDTEHGILKSLNDLVVYPSFFDKNETEEVLNVSLLRGISRNTVKEGYLRAYLGLPELTDYKFGFVCIGDAEESTYNLEFEVRRNSKPPSNVHAVIGRNGVGKTTLFNRMVESVVGKGNSAKGRFFKLSDNSLFSSAFENLPGDYFSRLISVSFGAFDTFRHPEDNDYPAKGPCFTYLGLIDRDSNRLKSQSDIYQEFSNSIANVLCVKEKRSQWNFVKDIICAGRNFEGVDLNRFDEIFEECGGEEMVLIEPQYFERNYLKIMPEFLKCFSSGHFIVLRILIDLLDRVESKTLVLIDEPETHLHPPLLSALVRAMSKILNLRNAVAIIATHSPVVLQEIPMSCVWKIHRTGLAFTASRPTTETYGENVGVLTEEVFGLDVRQSGFMADLVEEVSLGKSFDEILGDYQGQLGKEGKVILMSLIAIRDGR